MSNKVTYVISAVEKSLGFEWTLSGLKEAYDLDVILLNPHSSSFESFLQREGIHYRRRGIVGVLQKLTTFVWLINYFFKNRPQIVHCHLYEAGYLGITAAWLTGIKKRIYTRHYSLIHHIQYPKGLRIDKWINQKATHLVAVSGVVRSVMIDREKVPEEKVVTIPHGFHLREFQEVSPERVELVRQKHGINGQPVVGMISRFTELKGIQYVIQAFERILPTIPDAQLLLANAKGDYSDYLHSQLEKLPEQNWRTIEFEEDVQALYQCLDVFVHVPIGPEVEAFGQTYVEALAAGIPSVLTISGVAHDFIKHQKNSLVVDYESSVEIANAILELFENRKLATQLSENGKQSVKIFDIDQMINSVKQLYTIGKDTFTQKLTS